MQDLSFINCPHDHVEYDEVNGETYCGDCGFVLNKPDDEPSGAEELIY